MSAAEFNQHPISKICQTDIETLIAKAKKSEHGHYRLCLHQDNAAHIQEMIIVVLAEARFPPHKHPVGKSESIHLINGSLATFIFDDNGAVQQVIKLGKGQDLMQRIEGGIWHLPICMSDYVVYHETLVGPYNKEADVILPKWSSANTDLTALEHLYSKLKKSLEKNNEYE
ncbi:WbuC family cupin fold metalloprotein [Pseudoalteromonas luteoviolacea]|uniref:Cupin fold metalloprotein WbuC cupin domain-containing protein n=1 Tax=Pseudoalteromonas luteoviolacea H33 TaxID=1365251 RepID=A0A161XVL3_9GAMM|nr:WbuC family cupin fold metalloprotein [Pseudoalteromonas luteoviolacea]KZN47189.1 hypothetical protein N476_23710 [Pseudoalteromonas luteoviolacea H33]KZN77195.1 hypothetical protein N477_12480 [Pseudoalteromonas luteoviolacea H33-S]MBQ4879348.1 WbuC family cupin fold metalloprotein [Pseudoalteromonas luteoviolacea]MBQ4908408.1 WbuC family cupin fold metalloprotein [Pseudoalteromonas luteoviolacea]